MLSYIDSVQSHYLESDQGQVSLAKISYHLASTSATTHPFTMDRYAAEMRTQLQDSSALTERLRSIRNVPKAVANFISTEQPSLAPVVEPYLAGLRSGRLQTLQNLDLVLWHNDAPQLFKVEDASPTLDLKAVRGSALINVNNGTIYEGVKKNHPVPFESSAVTEFCDGWSVGLPKYVVNIPLGDIAFPPPRDIENEYHIYQQDGQENVFFAQANIGTAGSVVDLHDGNAPFWVVANHILIKHRPRVVWCQCNGRQTDQAMGTISVAS
jgi:hypothetical protein